MIGNGGGQHSKVFGLPTDCASGVCSRVDPHNLTKVRCTRDHGITTNASDATTDGVRKDGPPGKASMSVTHKTVDWRIQASLTEGKNGGKNGYD